VPAAPAVDPNAVLSRLEGLGIKLGLERARDLLVRMGEPQRGFPSVLVAGTNGATYRIATRTIVVAGVNYYLCADGSGICQQPR